MGKAKKNKTHAWGISNAPGALKIPQAWGLFLSAFPINPVIWVSRRTPQFLSRKSRKSSREDQTKKYFFEGGYSSVAVVLPVAAAGRLLVNEVRSALGAAAPFAGRE